MKSLSPDPNGKSANLYSHIVSQIVDTLRDCHRTQEIYL